MVMSAVKSNLMKYSLSRKGVMLFIFSKLAFLIFGIVIAAAFFYIITMQHNIQNLNEFARTSDSISNTIAMVSASKFKVWTVYESELNAKIIFENNSFTIYGTKNLTRSTYFPINANASDSDISLSCLNISNANGTVIKACQ